MDLPLHPQSLNCCVTNRAFAEGDRVVSYLVRESDGVIARRDLLESEDPPPLNLSSGAASGKMMPPAFVFCRWVTVFKPRRNDENPERTLKLTAENLFLTLADPAAERSETNTPLLQFLTLMLERKRQIKPRGRTADGERLLYEHMASHQLYEVPAGTLDDAFFVRIQEHLGVLVGESKKKETSQAAAVAT